LGGLDSKKKENMKMNKSWKNCFVFFKKMKQVNETPRKRKKKEVQQ